MRHKIYWIGYIFCVHLPLSPQNLQENDESALVMSYKLQPLKLGAEVIGFDLMQSCSSATIEQIKRDTHEHRILVFRGQNGMTPERQVEISKWFGEIDSAPYYKHPKSPTHEIFRVSNDRSEGCTNVGRTGWHIDGSFRHCPYAVSVYHMPHVPTTGDTRFVGMTEVYQNLNEAQKSKWNRLWMVADRHDDVVHPLVYKHPITNKTTLCFHCGMIDAFIEDYDKEKPRLLDSFESAKMLEEIHLAVVKNNEELVYSHKWTPGDFILSDNLAVGHEADPKSQAPRSQVGLRVLHRCTVAGTHKPKK